MKMKKRRICIIALFFLNFVFLLLFASTLVLSAKYLLKMKNKNIPDDRYEEFRLFQFNPKNNESSVGIARIHVVDPNINYSFQVQEEILLLYSKFETTEYFCSGTCYCTDEEKRRSTFILPRTLLFLVASLTSLVAIEEAKEYFSKECKNILSDDCSVSSIHTEDEKCEEIESNDDDENDESLDVRKFFCKGSCRARKFQKETTKQLAREFLCEKLELEGVQELVSSALVESTSYQKKNSRAIRLFQNEQLVPYCKEKSRVKYWWTRGTRGQNQVVSLCVGGGDRNKGINNSIHCKQIYPKYKKGYGRTAKSNMKYW